MKHLTDKQKAILYDLLMNDDADDVLENMLIDVLEIDKQLAKKIVKKRKELLENKR